MLQDVSIWLYTIKKCGYYSYRGVENRAPIFGEIASTFAEMQSWAQGKLLGQTATYNLSQ
jgi:hypothetical protein